MTLDPSPLFVTLVTGSSAPLRARAAHLVADDVWLAPPPRSADSWPENPARGEYIIESVLSAADEGLRGTLAVAVPTAYEPLELGLTMQAWLAERHPSEARVHVRDVVTAVEQSELAPLLEPATAADASPTALDALAARVEYATAVLVRCSPRSAAVDVLNALNPRAAILIDHKGRPVTRDRFRRSIRPPVGDLGSDQGWMLALNGSSSVASAAGYDRVVFRDPRPFHPERLRAVVEHCLQPEGVGTIWRSRGLFRLASRCERVGSWSSVGPSLSLDPTALTSDDPDAPVGQEIAFFGRDLDARALSRVLGSAVLADDELLAGPMEWATYPDPFPSWDRDHRH